MLKDDDALNIIYPDLPEFNSKAKLLKEKEVCGIYLTGHPLSDYKDAFIKYPFSTKKLEEYEETVSVDEEDGSEETVRTYTAIKEGDYVKFGGIIVSAERIMTKNGTYMCFVTVEDLYGSIECTLFPRTYAEAKDFAVIDELVEITGKLHVKGNEVSVNVEKIARLDFDGDKKEEASPETEFMGLILPDGKDCLDEVLDIAENYPGDVPVIVAINGKKYNARCSVRKCEALIAELKGLLDEKDIIFFKKKS